MILLVDIETVYDKVTHQYLKQVINNINLSNNYINKAVHSMYNGVQSQVLYDNTLSPFLTFSSGVIQNQMGAINWINCKFNI